MDVVSRALYEVSIPNELTPFVAAARALDGGEAIHPDAPELLRYCHRAAQAVLSLSVGKIRQLYLDVLRVRRRASQIAVAERESPGALHKDLTALAARCDGDNEDLVVVWQRLNGRARAQDIDELTPRQIRQARRCATIDRERSDAVGAGAFPSRARRLYAHALELLGRELQLTAAILSEIPLASYQAGTIRLPQTGERVALRLETACAIDAWLPARDKQSDKLLPEPCARRPREATVGPPRSRFWTHLACPHDDIRRLAAQETLASVWCKLGRNARALLFKRLSKRGACDPTFLESLAVDSAGISLAAVSLTRRQARTAQKEIDAVWERHPDRDNDPFRDAHG